MSKIPPQVHGKPYPLPALKVGPDPRAYSTGCCNSAGGVGVLRFTTIPHLAVSTSPAWSTLWRHRARSPSIAVYVCTAPCLQVNESIGCHFTEPDASVEDEAGMTTDYLPVTCLVDFQFHAVYSVAKAQSYLRLPTYHDFTCLG